MEKRLADEIGCRRDEVGAILNRLGMTGDAFGSERMYPSLLAATRQVVYLRIAGVAMATVVKLWETERKLIELLHGDSHGSETWMLDGWAESGKRRQRLFLSRYAIGADLDSLAVQPGLNFSGGSPELFAGSEMGEDALRVLKQYTELYGRLNKLLGRVQPLLQETARWAKKFS